MKNLLQFWRANHDIQPVIDLYATMEHILCYVTRIQKERSVIMKLASREAKDGDMELKESVRYIGNAFPSAVETSQQEAACLVLKVPMISMSL